MNGTGYEFGDLVHTNWNSLSEMKLETIEKGNLNQIKLNRGITSSKRVCSPTQMRFIDLFADPSLDTSITLLGSEEKSAAMGLRMQ